MVTVYLVDGSSVPKEVRNLLSVSLKGGGCDINGIPDEPPDRITCEPGGTAFIFTLVSEVNSTSIDPTDFVRCESIKTRTTKRNTYNI